MKRILLLSSFFLLLSFFSVASLFSLITSYDKKYSDTDKKLFSLFLTRADFLKMQKNYDQVLVEFKTAEQILNKRDSAEMSRLAKAYLNFVDYVIFYSGLDLRQLGEIIGDLSLAIKSGVRLDQNLYGEGRRLLLALYNKRVALSYKSKDKKKLKDLQNKYRAMGEKNNDTIMKAKILKHQADLIKAQLKKHKFALNSLESDFKQGLKIYKKSPNKEDRGNYMPLRKAIDNLIYNIPNPPGTKFLYELIKKYQCLPEFRAVMRMKLIK